MKKLKLSALVLTMAMLVSACSGAAPENSTKANEAVKTESNAHYPVTITTYNYKKEPVEITFEKAPEKVFAVYQDSIETLLALGLEDRIVAAAGLDQDVKAEYKDAFSKVNYLTEFAPDKESVIMLKPDFILSWYSYFSDKNLGDVSYWHQNGINTYMMLNSGAATGKTLENEYMDILNIGKIFDVEDKAMAIIDEMKTEIKQISDKAKSAGISPSVLLMEVEKDGIRVYGENTLGGDMIKNLGATLVTAPENQMSSEALIKADPEVIFTVYFGSSDNLKDAEAAVSMVTKDPKYSSLQAVKNNKVYAISLGEMYCSGTRTLDGIKTLSKGIYNERLK